MILVLPAILEMDVTAFVSTRVLTFHVIPAFNVTILRLVQNVTLAPLVIQEMDAPAYVLTLADSPRVSQVSYTSHFTCC